MHDEIEIDIKRIIDNIDVSKLLLDLTDPSRHFVEIEQLPQDNILKSSLVFPEEKNIIKDILFGGIKNDAT